MLKLMEDRAYLDGFKDILSIDNNSVNLLYKDYQLILEGENLMISAFTKSELILFGKINTVQFIYKNE